MKVQPVKVGDSECAACELKGQTIDLLDVDHEFFESEDPQLSLAEQLALNQ